MTLEDPVRDAKIAGETAIPAGVYHLTVTYSPKFKRRLPLLLNVPGFEYVRIHAGNTVDDTEGCILVGLVADGDTIRSSRLAEGELVKLLEGWNGTMEIAILAAPDVTTETV